MKPIGRRRNTHSEIGSVFRKNIKLTEARRLNTHTIEPRWRDVKTVTNNIFGIILSRNIRLEVVGEASYGVLANLT